VCTVGGHGSWNNGRREGYREQYVLDAKQLTIQREGAAIFLIRGRCLWARLYFCDYETMTLFFHTFLALRFHSPDAPEPEETEMWLQGEQLMFSAKIDLNGDMHNLRLLKDHDTGTIRLAAAKVIDTSDVTVWTTFITHLVTDPDFVRQTSKRTLVVKNIRQFSFSKCFETAKKSEYELKFVYQKDVGDFMAVIREDCRPPKPQRNSIPEYQRSPTNSATRNSYF